MMCTGFWPARTYGRVNNKSTVFIISVTQDIPPDFDVQPKSTSWKRQGDYLFMGCYYPDSITDVHWVHPDGTILSDDVPVHCFPTAGKCYYFYVDSTSFDVEST